MANVITFVTIDQVLTSAYVEKVFRWKLMTELVEVLLRVVHNK